MNREEVLEIFKQSGALLEGHFRLTSGMHSNRYMQCAQVLQYPNLTQQLCDELAARVSKVVGEVDVVIGPAMGGILVAYEVGRALKKKAIFTERDNGKMTLRRNFSIQAGQRVLVCEDVVTTGGSVHEVIEVVRQAEGQLVGVASLVDRSNGKADFGAPFVALLPMEVVAYQPDDCPMCKEGLLPAIKPGSRQA